MKESKVLESILGDICANENYGVVMRKWRNIFNVSQAELAEELGVQPSVISDYEGQRRTSPGIVLIRNYVNALIRIGRKKDKNIINKIGAYSLSGKKGLIAKDFEKELSIEALGKILNAKIILDSENVSVKKCVFFYDNIIDTFTSMSTSEFLNFMRGENTAVVFTNVHSGRFPFIVLKLLSSTKKISLPRFVVFQGETDSISKIVLRMAKNSGISIATTNCSKEDISGIINKL